MTDLKSRVTIVAEVGVNHNGELELARKLIEAAARAGADYVKFQTFTAEKHASHVAQKAEYQKLTGGESTQFAMLQRLELGRQDHYVLKTHCERCSIRFLSSAFDPDSVDFLVQLGMDFIKIPSGEITNLPLLRRVGKSGLPFVLSCGMATIDEINEALGVLYENKTSRDGIILLHCNTEYPTPVEDANLRAMHQLKETFKLPVGYSDHTMGINVALAAVALGAVMIEKHFTLDRSMPGPDHQASLEPDELAALVHGVREIELALGSGEKTPSVSERKNITVARKSLHLARPLAAGSLVEEEDLIALRPGDGISPMKLDEVVGRAVRVALPRGHKLQETDFA